MSKKQSAGNDRKTERQRLVSALRLRNLTAREIVEGLAKHGIKCGLGTVGRDLAELRRRWRDHAREDVSDYQAKQIAQLEAIQKQAWAQNDLDIVLKAHDRLTRLVGSEMINLEIRIARLEERHLQAAPGHLTRKVI